jgi:F-type H+-transporting ATPase subunit a
LAVPLAEGTTDEITREVYHPTWGSGFMAINIDTMRNLLIVSALLIVMAVYLRSRLRPDNPGRLQSILEAIIEFINGLIRETLGTKPINIAPLAISLFTFLLVANWIGLIPPFKSPTNDVNVAVFLALLSIVLLHYYSIKFRTFRGYIKHYFSVVTPKWLGPWGWTRVVFAFLEVIQELSRPITLSFRLYFNIFVGELMLALIIFLLKYFAVVVGPIWVGFSIFIGAIQAFIFTMLTIAYIAMGTEVSHAEEHLQGEEHVGPKAVPPHIPAERALAH